MKSLPGLIRRPCTADPAHSIGGHTRTCPTCGRWRQATYRRAAIRLRDLYPDQYADVEALAYIDYLRESVTR